MKNAILLIVLLVAGLGVGIGGAVYLTSQDDSPKLPPLQQGGEVVLDEQGDGEDAPKEDVVESVSITHVETHQMKLERTGQRFCFMRMEVFT